MKVKSNLIFNTSLLARHAPSVQDGKVVIGGDAVEYCVVPAGATLTLDDAEWHKFEKAAAPMVESGALEILVPPKKTLEEQAESDRAELEAAEAKAKKLKAKLAKAEKPAKSEAK